MGVRQAQSQMHVCMETIRNIWDMGILQNDENILANEDDKYKSNKTDKWKKVLKLIKDKL